jgi:hypothetical protein
MSVVVVDIKRSKEIAFGSACEHGNIQYALNLLVHNPTLDISAENEFAFRYACSNGHLHVAQWLLKIKPNINISAENEHAFCYACSNGHLYVAQWLLKIKPTLDISADNEEAFRSACINSRVEVAQWLQSLQPFRYVITIENNKITHYHVIKHLLYFEEPVELKEEDTICPVCSENGVAVQTVCKHNYCTNCLTKWLSSHSTCPYCRDPINNVFRIRQVE